MNTSHGDNLLNKDELILFFVCPYLLFLVDTLDKHV